MNSPQPPHDRPQQPGPGQPPPGQPYGRPGPGPGPQGVPGQPGPGYGQPPRPPQQPYPGQPQGQPPHGQPPQGRPPQGPPQQYGQPQHGQPQYGHGQPGPGYGAPGSPAPAPQGPPQGYPAAPGQGGTQGIALDAKFFPLMWIFLLIKPKIEIDGQLQPNTAWHQNTFPLSPGQHHLHVHVPYFLPPKVGKADTTVTVAPNQMVPLEYRAPAWVFSKGSLGPAPQKYNGFGAMAAVFVVTFVLILLIALLPVLLAG